MDLHKPAVPFEFLAIGLVLALFVFLGILGWSKALIPSSANLSTSNLRPGSMSMSPVDGVYAIYIPAGDFMMGHARDVNSSPVHSVYLDAYWIDQTEVTNAMYAKCVEAEKCFFYVKHSTEEIHYHEPAYPNDPVVFITWFDAVNYCQWAGKRLPTEAEWEKAARGIDRRPFPWGDSPPDWSLLNFDNLIGDTTPVATFLAGASPYGVLDMAGNVREWVADWYNSNYYKFSPRKNPLGPDSGEKRVLRGGSFIDNYQRVSATKRFEHLPDSGGVNRGFRCVSTTWPIPEN